MDISNRGAVKNKCTGILLMMIDDSILEITSEHPEIFTKKSISKFQGKVTNEKLQINEYDKMNSK